jgi:1-acyl-sn-glycerol-3-phosphate acyltransferase
MTRYHLVKILLALVVKIVARVEVKGLEHIPRNKAFILAVNHLTLLEPPVLFVIIPLKRVTVFVGERWAGHPFIGWILRSADAIFVNREAVFDRQAIKAALAALKAGVIVGMAPEGKRSQTGGLIRAKAGVAYLAHKADVPVLPVGISGQKDFARTLKRLRRLHLRVNIGQLIYLPPLVGADKGDYFQKCADEIMVTIAHLIDPELRGVYASLTNCSNFKTD